MKTPFIKREALEKIVEEFPTPFHLYDEKGIREKARAVNQAFSWNKGIRAPRFPRRFARCRSASSSSTC